MFDVIDTALLRKQQICLGLLKAVRVLLSPQEHLRKIILSSETAGGTTQTLFQLLMQTAVKPSPIKPIFGREELEVKSYMIHRSKIDCRVSIYTQSFAVIIQECLRKRGIEIPNKSMTRNFTTQE